MQCSFFPKHLFHFPAVDDGSGVIRCLSWAKTSDASVPDTNAMISADYIALTATSSKEDSPLPFEIGTLVTVRGRVKEYNNVREVVVATMGK